jgi:CDP-4-dehydro-6-deoxyglucose reductase, E1
MKIPLSVSTFGEEEIFAATEVLRSGSLTMGHLCERFEEEFAEYFGVRNAIFVNSGSSANLLAFFALANPELPLRGRRRRFRPGDEIIAPAVTWSTTIWPIVQAGGVPVLVDSDPKTLQMDLRQVEALITPRTVAICPVHVLGNAVPMKPILELADRYGLWVIEDTCEALGTRHDGRYVGTFGDLASFSFFFSHHITTIEGGMVVTNDDELGELLRCLRAHGWTRQLKNRFAAESKYPHLDPRFLFVTTGFNVRPTEVNAAFGLRQLPKLAAFNRRRAEVAGKWCADFRPITERGLLVPMQTTPGTESTWFGFPVLMADTHLRDQFQIHLERAGIETRPVICGNLARQPAFRNITHRTSPALEGADRVMDLGLFWGNHPNISDDDAEYVSRTVREFFKS